MRAVTVVAGRPHSAELREIPEPDRAEGNVLLRTLAVGVCGTDREILDGAYGKSPPGRDWFVLGHEALGMVVEAPSDSGLAPGDLAVPIVRHPDPVPCTQCAVGEWDMCRNGRYTEHGIRGLDGFAREWFRTTVSHAVRVDSSLGLAGVLLEPASVVAKAWSQIERIGARSRWTPTRVLVLGAGPIGLLSALFGVQRNLEVHVLDRVTDGPKPALVEALGASYHSGSIAEVCLDIDVVLECTGASSLVFEAMRCVAPAGIVCLTGVSSGSRALQVDAASLNNELVLENNVVFGTVNANRLHYELAADALAAASREWLHRLITRRVPLDRWDEAYERFEGDVKTVLQFADAAAH
jgi:threonine dehydrogenase-like Zn-dependent dehydrogenase